MLKKIQQYLDSILICCISPFGFNSLAFLQAYNYTDCKYYPVSHYCMLLSPIDATEQEL